MAHWTDAFTRVAVNGIKTCRIFKQFNHCTQTGYIEVFLYREGQLCGCVAACVFYEKDILPGTFREMTLDQYSRVDCHHTAEEMTTAINEELERRKLPWEN
jgi:hypothetical protein